VRESIGAVFESLNFDERWLVLDLLLGDDLEVELPTYALQVCNPGRPWVANMVPGGRFRVEVQVAEGEDEKHLRSKKFLHDLLRPLLGEAQFEIERNAVYEFHGLVADTWRQGRVFLAGDSAHLMPPFLGQGMVSGIRDAQNLAWKLAGVVDGTFPESILDTYETERSPHVRSITASAIEIGRFVGASDPVEVAERNRRLRAGDVSGAPSFRLPALEQGPLILAGGGDLFPQPLNPVSGRPELDAVFGDDLVIVSMDGIAETDAAKWWRDSWGAHLVEVSSLGADSDPIAAWFTKAGANVAIVRPDRYVLGAGESLEAITEAVREHQDSVSPRG
jgi:3-(3-hydroxy-phenyl)propionate hydroxylase